MELYKVENAKRDIVTALYCERRDNLVTTGLYQICQDNLVTLSWQLGTTRQTVGTQLVDGLLSRIATTCEIITYVLLTCNH